jgi:thermolysin
MSRFALVGVSVVALLLAAQINGTAQRSVLLQVQATSGGDLRTWDAYITQRERSGNLRVRKVERDPLLPSRTIERLQQFHRGVPIWGAEVVRDSERGLPVSIFGVLSPDLTLSVDPSLSLEQGREALFRIGGADAAVLALPQLVIVRLDDGDHRLAYTGVVSGGGQVLRVFLDAHTGAELLRYSEIQTQQQAVGTGRGVLGDLKKLSVEAEAGRYVAFDTHRPPVIATHDMHRNLTRSISVLFENGDLFASDQASDADNDWTDPAVVDAHVHVSWTYDYFFKRFGRHGLDDRESPMIILTNALSQQDALSFSPSSAVVGFLVVNAAWCGGCGPDGAGVMFFGNGIPPGYSFPSSHWLAGRNVTYLAGSLDIAAHELTHAVTQFSSGLIYRNESGALNEAFSDMMGTSAEFFYHPAGSGLGRADYLMGEDSFRASSSDSQSGIRSMENPSLFGDPDHFTRRMTGSGDNGGVHANSAIPNQAFFLAIEGGTNRTSGLSVQGVGAGNREQIEKVFYRAFVSLLPANSTFSTARAATVRAAQDLYGGGGPVERAVTQAWAAVGIF